MVEREFVEIMTAIGVGSAVGNYSASPDLPIPRAQPVMHFGLDVAILSLFCAGGLFAYIREALRLNRLLSSGKVAVARILDARMDASGESVVHYLVKYEFVDEEGLPVVHEQVVNSRQFFDTLQPGGTIEVLYDGVGADNSYPTDQIRSDRKLSGLIAAAIFVFWVLMGAFFAVR